MDHDQHDADVEHDHTHEEESRELLSALREHIGDDPLIGLLQECEATYSTLMAMDNALDGVRPRLDDPALIGIITPLHEMLIEVIHQAVIFSNAIAILEEERTVGRES